MKVLIKLLLLSVLLFVGCNDKDEDAEVLISSKKISQITLLKYGGGEGGKTNYIKSPNLTGKGENMFISQYPLVEQRYELKIYYDSIVEYTIDSISQDTISLNDYVVETGRDTINYQIGKLWLPFGENINTREKEIYIGGVEDFEDDEIRITWEDKDDYGNNSEFYSLLYKCINKREGSDGNQCFSGEKDTKLLSNIVYEKTNIPIFDNVGNVIEYKEGYKLPLSLVQYDTQYIDDIDRKFRITITAVNEIDSVSVSQDFELYFTSELEYSKRKCWLEGNSECSDFFTE